MRFLYLFVILVFVLSIACGGEEEQPALKKKTDDPEGADLVTKKAFTKKDETKKDEKKETPMKKVVDSESLIRYQPKVTASLTGDLEWERYPDTVPGSISWGLYESKVPVQDRTKVKALLLVDIMDMTNRPEEKTPFTKEFKKLPAKLEENEYIYVWAGKFMVRVMKSGSDVPEETKEKYSKQVILDEVISSIDLERLSKF
jgi:hypothetical protein